MELAAQHLERSPLSRMLTEGNADSLEGRVTEANPPEMANLFPKEPGNTSIPEVSVITKLILYIFKDFRSLCQKFIQVLLLNQLQLSDIDLPKLITLSNAGSFNLD